MAKRCIYCKAEIDDTSVIELCERCGQGVWGKKMFDPIVNNMTQARETGNLNQGSVGEIEISKETKKNRGF